MRLIDADALEVVCFKDKGGCFSDGVQWVLEKIDALPTVQPQTGGWDSLGDVMDVGDGKEIQCNKCKATYMIVYRDGDYNFCPNCGARMVAE